MRLLFDYQKLFHNTQMDLQRYVMYIRKYFLLGGLEMYMKSLQLLEFYFQ